MRASYVLAVAAFALATPAFAATTVYKGFDNNPANSGSIATNPNADAANAAFQAQLSGVSTQGFESFATGSPPPLALTFSGGISATLTGSGSVQSATRASPTSTGQYAVAGSKYYEIEGTNFTVTFNTPIAAFGFYGTDLELPNNIIVTLNRSGGGASESFNLGTVFGQTTQVNSGSVHFLGFINAANPFTSVVFSGTGAGGDILAFDQFTVGTSRQVTGGVPEPATWAMMIMGFGLVGGAMRRRSTKVAFAA